MLAKQKPNELLYGASGLGSGPHLAAELFKQMAGVKMTGVLYPGSGQTVTDLISGRIQVMFSPASTVLGFIKDGRVKALATSEAERSSHRSSLPWGRIETAVADSSSACPRTRCAERDRRRVARATVGVASCRPLSPAGRLSPQSRHVPARAGFARALKYKRDARRDEAAVARSSESK